MALHSFGQSALPRYDEHAPLDEASAAVVAQAAAAPTAKWWDQDIAASRADYADMIASVGCPEGPETDRARIDIRTGVGGLLPLHIYRPRTGGRPPTCTVLFLRGSGMCMGNMELYEGILQRLCSGSEALIVAPDYRLAPEHPFPAGHDDAYEAFSWLRQNAAAIGGNAGKLVVIGDSAGGMLAVATALHAATEHPGAIAFMILVAPALGTRPDSPSVVRYGRGHLLDVADLAWLYRTYSGGRADVDDPMVFPIFATDLSGLPPTLMITAGADIMRDDAEVFLRRMQAAGVAVELHRYEGTIHPFLNMGGVIPVSKEAIDRMGATLRRIFGRSEEGALRPLR